MSSTRPRLQAGATLAAAAWGVQHLSSPAVRHWPPSTAPVLRAGRLRVRVLGSGESSVVLLHGIVGCGDYFGASYDRLGSGHRLLVPDLLGFGDFYRVAAPTGYGLTAHLDALDEMAESLGLSGALTVVGHSMGAVLGLHWAARRSADVRGVVALSAPLYLSSGEGLEHIRGLGRLEATMALDTALSRHTCALMCHYRRTAGWVAAAIKPSLPVHLARRGVLHTWPAYQAAMADIVLASPWQPALQRLAVAGVPVLFGAGRRDPVPVRDRAEELAAHYTNVTAEEHPWAGHDLPLVDPAWCLDLLLGRPTSR